jgi:hypothetical protein
MMMNTTTARAVRYIYRDSREKTERESPLLHREMICHMIEAALLSWAKSSSKIRLKSNAQQPKKSFCPSEKSVFTFGFFRHKISNSSLSLAHNTTRAIHIK